MDSTLLDWTSVVGLIAVGVFLWRLSHTLTKDVRELSERASGVAERLARIEGFIEGRFNKSPQPNE